MREKLIELITAYFGVDPAYYGIETAHFADHLIANGVTVQKKKRFLLKENGDLIPLDQEWISVKDRLPEDDSDVLAYLQIGEESRIYPANYAKGMWFDCLFNTPATDSTTHWMPLPHPPKGE